MADIKLLVMRLLGAAENVFARSLAPKLLTHFQSRQLVHRVDRRAVTLVERNKTIAWLLRQVLAKLTVKGKTG